MSNRFVRWGVYLLIASAFAAACAFLAQWQFDRNESRTAQIALVEANYDRPPVPLHDLIGSDGALDPADEWRQVLLQGEYAAEDQVLVRNRPHGGTRAFEVIVPFHTDDDRVFLVNRGWVLSGEGDSPDSVAAPASGPVEVIVRLRPGEPLPTSGRSAPEGQVPTIHLPSIAEVSGAGTITGAYGQIVSEAPAPEVFLGGFDAPTEDPGPHLSYAIQWILFAIMGFVFIAYIIRTETTRRREEAAGTVVAASDRRRRRDRDAEAEDALLDA